MSEIKFNIPDPIRRPPRTTGVVKRAKVERNKVYWHIVYGFLWWAGTSAVLYFALASTNPGFYYYGGLIGALYHWKNAIKVANATMSVRSKKLFGKELIGIVATMILVAGTTAVILPETVRVESPRIGTCWAEVSEGFVPVACWGSNARFETIAFASTAETCPTGSVHSLKPDEYEFNFTCLVTR
jgi:hypothetical protein